MSWGNSQLFFIPRHSWTCGSNYLKKQTNLETQGEWPYIRIALHLFQRKSVIYKIWCFNYCSVNNSVLSITIKWDLGWKLLRSNWQTAKNSSLGQKRQTKPVRKGLGGSWNLLVQLAVWLAVLGKLASVSVGVCCGGCHAILFLSCYSFRFAAGGGDRVQW